MSSGKVVPFPGQAAPEQMQPVAHIVEECERLLAMAKSGEIVAMGCALIFASGANQTTYSNAAEHTRSLVATADVLHHRLMTYWLEP